MDKAEYIKWLREWGACGEGVEWVESRPEDNARDILLAVDRVDWLVWNIGYKDQAKAASFAWRAASRARPTACAYAAKAAWWAERAAAAVTAGMACKAAEATSWWAAVCQPGVARQLELQAQLEDLHQLVKEVF